MCVWLLCHIWKARNSFCFEHQRSILSSISARAKEEAEVWLNLNTHSSELQPCIRRSHNAPLSWKEPPNGWLKCNVGASWIHRHRNSEAAWILRDHLGRPSHHSRRSLSGCSSIIEIELQVLSWSLHSLKDIRVRRVIIESSFVGARDALIHPENFLLLQPLIFEIPQTLNSFVDWSLEYISPECNKVALLIAQSVTSGHRYQSYLATGGPHWLDLTIREEASFADL